MNPEKVYFNSVFRDTKNMKVLRYVIEHCDDIFDPVIAKFICERFVSSVRCSLHKDNPYWILGQKIDSLEYKTNESSPFQKHDYVRTVNGDVGFVYGAWGNTIGIEPINGSVSFTVNIQEVRWCNLPNALRKFMNLNEEKK